MMHFALALLSLLLNTSPADAEEAGPLLEKIAIARPADLKNVSVRVPITILAFDSTYNEKRIQDELDKFNAIFSVCGIQLIGEIPVRIFSSKGLKTIYACDIFGATSSENIRWAKLQKQYSKEGIVATYLSYNDEGFGINLLNKGCSQRRESKRFSSPNGPNLNFPPYAIYLSDYLREDISKTNSYENSVVTFSHELGHIILDEGHNNDTPSLFHEGNLMCGFESKEKPRRAKATGLTSEQCQKAHEFLKRYNPETD